jgi:hypothetical protein
MVVSLDLIHAWAQCEKLFIQLQSYIVGLSHAGFYWLLAREDRHFKSLHVALALLLYRPASVNMLKPYEA